MFTNDIFNHLKKVKQAIDKWGGEAHVDVRTLALEVGTHDRRVELPAQFLVIKDGRNSYFNKFSPDSDAFIGWYPTLNKVWDSASDKLAFKTLLMQHGLRTPALSFESPENFKTFIIKRRDSSFGADQKGPFHTEDVNAQLERLNEGEFYEEFTPGWIAKAWFWNGRAVGLKLREMPAIVGDGIASVRVLIDRETACLSRHFPIGWFDSHDWRVVDNLLALQGMAYDTVLSAGEQVMVDYRYINPWVRFNWDYDNLLPCTDSPFIREQLEHVGLIVYQSIPESVRVNSLFTVDAILDQKDNFWFLEANCNPQLHPDLYEPIFTSLLGESVNNLHSETTPSPQE